MDDSMLPRKADLVLSKLQGISRSLSEHYHFAEHHCTSAVPVTEVTGHTKP